MLSTALARGDLTPLDASEGRKSGEFKGSAALAFDTYKKVFIQFEITSS